jgi:hypothetical protein
MTAKRFMVDNFARTGLFETLGGGTVGFDLRHMKISPFEYTMLSLLRTKTDGASNITTGPRHPINVSLSLGGQRATCVTFFGRPNGRQSSFRRQDYE